MTFLTKAGLIEKIAPKTYRATALAQEFLRNHPDSISIGDLEKLPGYEEAWAAGSAKRAERNSPKQVPDVDTKETSTPDEIIDQQISALEADVRGRLLDTIVNQSPAFFEELVLDVLLAMGYGGSRENAAKHMGRSGDEGIDGCINQDSLGLDQIMIQAKKYRPDRAIDRKEIQAFIGSLAGQGVTKGVFITTSRFLPSAHEFIKRGATTKIVLVDGEALLGFMIQHRIGVRIKRTHLIHEIDQNYFEMDE